MPSTKTRVKAKPLRQPQDICPCFGFAIKLLPKFRTDDNGNPRYCDSEGFNSSPMLDVMEYDTRNVFYSIQAAHCSARAKGFQSGEYELYQVYVARSTGYPS